MLNIHHRYHHDAPKLLIYLATLRQKKKYFALMVVVVWDFPNKLQFHFLFVSPKVMASSHPPNDHHNHDHRRRHLHISTAKQLPVEGTSLVC